MKAKALLLKKVITKLPVLCFDVVSIPIAWYLAFMLRHNMQFIPQVLLSAYSFFALVTLTFLQVGCYYYFKVPRGLWRFSSLNDVVRIIKAVFSATGLAIPILYFFSILQHIPRSIFPLYCLLLGVLLCGGRLLYRYYWDKNYTHGKISDNKKVLIIGAGQAGDGLIRDLKRTRSYLPVGILDDNSSKHGLELHGVRVLGNIRELTKYVTRFGIDLIFIAIPSARSAEMRQIVNLCERCKIPFRTLPSIQAVALGRIEVSALREVHIEDLLGRDQIQLQWDRIGASIQNRCIVVTGGGGSIGSELCRQIIALKPKKLLIVDNSEYNLYKINLELTANFSEVIIETALISICDRVAVNFLFKQFQPEIVFHAAAYKHVPLLEDQIRAAVQNNIIGTEIVSEASVLVGVEKFILISSDKAVNPTNIMGTTKRIAEIYCQNLNSRVTTEFITVRFGNVLGSVGSVVPLFQSQLQNGGPLTVTHPEMQRYFMTIAEASQLILQAMVNGTGGEIYVLDMGEPVKISYLAEQMIRLAGKEPGEDIQIEYIGLRPGEKLFEELFHTSEALAPTGHEKLFKARVRQMNWNDLNEAVQLLHKACSMHQNDELLVLLRSLVPEFNCDIGLLSVNPNEIGLPHEQCSSS